MFLVAHPRCPNRRGCSFPLRCDQFLDCATEKRGSHLHHQANAKCDLTWKHPQSRSESSPEEIVDLDEEANIDVSLSPFQEIETIDVPFDPSSETPLGFEIARCASFRRAFAHDFAIEVTLDGRYPAYVRKHFQGAYILGLHGRPVYSPEDAAAILQDLRDTSSPPDTVRVTFALDMKGSLHDRRPSPLHLRAIDIRGRGYQLRFLRLSSRPS